MIKTLLLQASTGGANYTQFIMLAGMVAIFYFFFIRPQQKKQKDQKKFIEAIKKGDQVVTLGGIHLKLKEKDLHVDIYDRNVEPKKIELFSRESVWVFTGHPQGGATILECE